VADRLFWPCWLVASALTGVVAGFMLGHALILARFLDWLHASGLLARTYPVFRGSSGRAGLEAYYAVAGLQVLAVLAFAAVALAARRHRAAAVVAGVAGVLWIVVHYASGFGALEAAVLQSAAEAPAEVAARFRAWNAPLHLVHAGSLAAALVALLSVPLADLRRRVV
jgi:hypothetical protein